MDLKKGDMLWDLAAAFIQFVQEFINDVVFNKDETSLIYLLLSIAILLIALYFLGKIASFIVRGITHHKNNKLLDTLVQRLDDSLSHNNAVAVESLPLESLPVESLPVESLPVESLPVESLPNDTNSEDFDSSLSSSDRELLLAVKNDGIDSFKKLLKQCRKLGKRIDKYTARKDNSLMVAILVFKIAENKKIPLELALLYLCVSLVYDCGFLDIPEELFHAEILSYNEISLIRTHVLRTEKYLEFVPKQYYELFYQTSMLHHGNVDGSGYPEGLKGTDIPIVARIIHVVESYVSLTTKRSYHKTLNKKSAFAELKKSGETYDAEIINILERIILKK